MEQNYRFQDVVDFLEYAGNHGLIKASTAQSYRVGCSKIEEALTPDELADVRKIDVDAVFTRFANANKIQVSPATLREYRRRVATSIEEFLEWRKDPSGYKPKGSRSNKSKGEDGTSGTKKRVKRAKVGETDSSSVTSSESIVSSAQTSAPLLSLPYPIRANLLAHIQVPRDLTSEEANRLAAFIKTLATDFAPEK